MQRQLINRDFVIKPDLRLVISSALDSSKTIENRNVKRNRKTTIFIDIDKALSMIINYLQSPALKFEYSHLEFFRWHLEVDRDCLSLTDRHQFPERRE